MGNHQDSNLHLSDQQSDHSDFETGTMQRSMMPPQTGDTPPDDLHRNINQSPRVQQLKTYQDRANSQSPGPRSFAPVQMLEGDDEVSLVPPQIMQDGEMVDEPFPNNQLNQNLITIPEETDFEEDDLDNGVSPPPSPRRMQEDENRDENFNELLDDEGVQQEQEQQIERPSPWTPLNEVDDSLDNMSYKRRTLGQKWGTGPNGMTKHLPPRSVWGDLFRPFHITKMTQLQMDLSKYLKHTEEYRLMEDKIEEYQRLYQSYYDPNRDVDKLSFNRSLVDNSLILVSLEKMKQLKKEISELAVKLQKQDNQKYREDENNYLMKLRGSSNKWLREQKFTTDLPGNDLENAKILMMELAELLPNMPEDNPFELVWNRYGEHSLLKNLRKLSFESGDLARVHPEMVKAFDQFNTHWFIYREGEKYKSPQLLAKDKTEQFNSNKDDEYDTEYALEEGKKLRKKLESIIPVWLRGLKEWENNPDQTRNGIEFMNNVDQTLLNSNQELGLDQEKPHRLMMGRQFDWETQKHLIGAPTIKETVKDQVPILSTSAISKLQDNLKKMSKLDQHQQPYHRNNLKKRFDIAGNILKYSQEVIGGNPQWTNSKNSNHGTYLHLIAIRDEAIRVRNEIGKELNVEGFDEKSIQKREELRGLIDSVLQDPSFHRIRRDQKPSRKKKIKQGIKEPKSIVKYLPVVGKYLALAINIGEYHEYNSQKELYSGLAKIAHLSGNEFQRILAYGLAEHYMAKRRNKGIEFSGRVISLGLDHFGPSIPTPIPDVSSNLLSIQGSNTTNTTTTNPLTDLSNTLKGNTLSSTEQGINTGVNQSVEELNSGIISSPEKVTKKTAKKSLQEGNKNLQKKKKEDNSDEEQNMSTRLDHINFEVMVNDGDFIRSMLIYLSQPNSLVSSDEAHSKLCGMMNMDPEENQLSKFNKVDKKDRKLLQKISHIRRKTKGKFSLINKGEKVERARRNTIDLYEKNKDQLDNMDLGMNMLEQTSYRKNKSYFQKKRHKSMVTNKLKNRLKTGIHPDKYISGEDQLRPIPNQQPLSKISLEDKLQILKKQLNSKMKYSQEEQELLQEEQFKLLMEDLMTVEEIIMEGLLDDHQEQEISELLDKSLDHLEEEQVNDPINPELDNPEELNGIEPLRINNLPPIEEEPMDQNELVPGQVLDQQQDELQPGMVKKKSNSQFVDTDLEGHDQNEKNDYQQEDYNGIYDVIDEVPIDDQEVLDKEFEKEDKFWDLKQDGVEENLIVNDDLNKDEEEDIEVKVDLKKKEEQQNEPLVKDEPKLERNDDIDEEEQSDNLSSNENLRELNQIEIPNKKPGSRPSKSKKKKKSGQKKSNEDHKYHFRNQHWIHSVYKYQHQHISRLENRKELQEIVSIAKIYGDKDGMTPKFLKLAEQAKEKLKEKKSVEQNSKPKKKKRKKNQNGDRKKIAEIQN